MGKTWVSERIYTKKAFIYGENLGFREDLYSLGNGKKDIENCEQ